MEDLDSLPLLDMVVKEILRLHPSINLTVREAKRDDVIPLAEEIRLKSGEVVREVRIRKGQYVSAVLSHAISSILTQIVAIYQMYLPIEGLNLSKDAWGEDSTEFRQVPPSSYSPKNSHADAQTLLPDLLAGQTPKF